MVDASLINIIDGNYAVPADGRYFIYRAAHISVRPRSAAGGELNGIIGGDRYFLSDRIKTPKAIRAKILPDQAREPLPLPPKQYAPPRAKGRQRRG